MMCLRTRRPYSLSHRTGRAWEAGGGRSRERHSDHDVPARRPRGLHPCPSGTAEPTTGNRIVATVGRQLSDRFGPGFGRSNLARMVSFARTYPHHDETLALAHRLTWTHIRDLLSLKSHEAHAFYAEEPSSKRLSVREMRAAVARKAYGRHEIANSQVPDGSAAPRDTFRDPAHPRLPRPPRLLPGEGSGGRDFRDVQAFLLEVGQGFAFIASQKRMTVDGDDFLPGPPILQPPPPPPDGRRAEDREAHAELQGSKCRSWRTR